MIPLSKLTEVQMNELYETCKRYAFNAHLDDKYYIFFYREMLPLCDAYGYKHQVLYDFNSIDIIQITVYGIGETYVFDVKKEMRINKIKSFL